MLPAGYVLNLDGSDGEESDGLTLEERIEEDRAKLPSEGLIPVTKESFFEWKKQKAAEAQAIIDEKIAKEQAKGRKDVNAYKFMSGRALFTYDPTLFQDDDDAVEDALYEEGDAPLEEVKEEDTED